MCRDISSQRKNRDKGGSDCGDNGSEVKKLKCVTCDKVGGEEDKCIECEDCPQWSHAGCVGILNGELLDMFANLPGAHWFCSICDKVSSKLCKLEKKVAGMPAEINTLGKNRSIVQNMLSDLVTPKLDSMQTLCTDTRVEVKA